MPITGEFGNLGSIKTASDRLSAGMTIQDLVSQVRTETNQLDNTRIQDKQIRQYINIALSNVAEMLTASNDPFYGIQWTGTLDDDPDSPTALPNWIDLTTAVGGEVPQRILRKVNKLNCAGYGNCAKLELPEIDTVAQGTNTQWNQSIAWCHHGGLLYVFVGSEILSALSIDQTTVFRLYGVRQPQLDDLLFPSTSATYTQPVDCPDRHMRLLALLVERSVIGALGQDIPIHLDNAIAGLTRNMNTTNQEEAAGAVQRQKLTEQGY